MPNLDLFEQPKTPIAIDRKIRLIELFAGYGSQAMGMERIRDYFNIPDLFETHKVCEFDKYAIDSYNIVHNTNYPTIDITTLHGKDLEISEHDKYCYIMFYSSPCTDLSNAGLQKGMAEGSGTRSGLLWECKRILEELRADNNNLPEILIQENVAAIHSNKFMPDFQKWIDYLSSIGYTSTWFDLNAKDYGVAQNRKRTFMISMLGDYTFTPPAPMELTKCMADYLDEEVDEKYYINNDRANQLILNLKDRGELPDFENKKKL